MTGFVERRAEFVYNAARLAAIGSGAPIVPDVWEDREEPFKKQFLDVIERQCGEQRSRSPKELHGGWMQSYFDMGWVYGEEYAKTISKYALSWGAISKWIPERHTTRTFEIPACGTALITERNDEIHSFFNDDEVIFYSSEQEFVEKIKYFLNNRNELKLLSEKGYRKVISAGYDYKSILKKILTQAEII